MYEKIPGAWPRRLRAALAGAAGVLLALLTSAALAAGPGSKFYQELLEQDGLYPDQAWQDYVDAIGQRLLAETPHAGRDSVHGSWRSPNTCWVM